MEMHGSASPFRKEASSSGVHSPFLCSLSDDKDLHTGSRSHNNNKNIWKHYLEIVDVTPETERQDTGGWGQYPERSQLAEMNLNPALRF